jgi:hypothetical protein
MRRQSGLPTSRTALLVPRNQPQVTALLVQRVFMPAQPLLPLTRDCAVASVGQQQIQAWWERLWPNLRTKERLHLYAFVCRELANTLRALLNLACARLTLLRCPLRGSLQREAALCQR